MTSEFTIAVHALVFLNHKAITLSSETLAKNICTNPARIRKVMAKLKKAGLVTTKEGVDGGYLFDADPTKVSLQQVNDAVGARIVYSSWRSGSMDKKCLIASGMAEVMDDIYDQLDQSCKEQLQTITICDIDKRIFGNEL
ncbi:Rrf2 family transcriptional regulator [Hydrogenoanaerobacterium sp.]|uniref:RrF2 family transcriptional regulator n=1 Tax=Hydrogenoanaerobacterium sp. TaxID=2953763 RepID=UPI00289F3217|nr:Rrf2 family transcriptional regulator [Hydrogenoanaerobacterium sp.]